MDSVAPLAVTTARVFALRDTEKRLLFEEALDAIVAQRRRAGLFGDLLIRVIHLRGAKRPCLGLLGKERECSGDMFHVRRLSSHELLEAVSLGMVDSLVDVRFRSVIGLLLFAAARRVASLETHLVTSDFPVPIFP